MRPTPRSFARHAFTLALLAALAAMAATAPALWRSHAVAEAAPAMHHHDMAGMSDAEMQRQVAAWFATHPVRVGSVNADLPAATFNASGFAFDADNNLSTVVDTAKIFAGQSVLWQWQSGFHTVTNGTGSGDPNAGLLFDVPHDSGHPTFQFRFDNVGTVPFFCRLHEGFNMKGVVVVKAPSATFVAGGTTFNADGNAGTNPDTVRIQVHQAVTWHWSDGFHTVTNGTGSGDPNAGTLFNHPLDSSNTVFTFVFTSNGTFPFFCQPHEGFGMKGVVIVGNGGAAVPPVAPALGFASMPAPNPTRSGIAFRYALPAAGHARATVLDAQGRRVATLVDADMPAGTWHVSWDGRIQNAPAAPGVYHVRLELPGFDEVRQVSLVR